jgi:hypothetical protein
MSAKTAAKPTPTKSAPAPAADKNAKTAAEKPKTTTAAPASTAAGGAASATANASIPLVHSTTGGVKIHLSAATQAPASAAATIDALQQDHICTLISSATSPLVCCVPPFA